MADWLSYLQEPPQLEDVSGRAPIIHELHVVGLLNMQTSESDGRARFWWMSSPPSTPHPAQQLLGSDVTACSGHHPLCASHQTKRLIDHRVYQPGHHCPGKPPRQTRRKPHHRIVHECPLSPAALSHHRRQSRPHRTVNTLRAAQGVQLRRLRTLYLCRCSGHCSTFRRGPGPAIECGH